MMMMVQLHNVDNSVYVEDRMQPKQTVRGLANAATVDCRRDKMSEERILQVGHSLSTTPTPVYKVV